MPYDYAKAISDYPYQRLHDRREFSSSRQSQRPVSQTGSVHGPLESDSFISLFPLAGFRRTGLDKVREAQFAPECSAM
jgi:hypothetical protein